VRLTFTDASLAAGDIVNIYSCASSDCSEYQVLGYGAQGQWTVEAQYALALEWLHARFTAVLLPNFTQE
jgi:hypothetical protein